MCLGISESIFENSFMRLDICLRTPPQFKNCKNKIKDYYEINPA